MSCLSRVSSIPNSFFTVFGCMQKNKGMVPVGSVSTEEMDENYVPMSVHSSSHHRSSSLSEPIQEPNYVPMTPGTVEFSSLGKQVPPPAHMGFRSSPKTPPRRAMPITECQPPPVDRNLKPDRKGEPWGLFLLWCVWYKCVSVYSACISSALQHFSLTGAGPCLWNISSTWNASETNVDRVLRLLVVIRS